MSDNESQPNLILRILNRIRDPLPEPSPPKGIELAGGILRQVQLTKNASYYSGIPANRKDCDERKLKNIYEILKENTDKPAAYNFANMIIDMPSLAPSNIISALLRYQATTGFTNQKKYLQAIHMKRLYF